jgi:predicted nucleotidyltransferase
MSPLLQAHRLELDALCRRFHVRRLDAFGSAVKGYMHDGSDLDFLVEFEPLPEGGYADAYFGLLEALQALFRKSVDLVVASAIRNPYFRQSVEASRMPLYAA